MSRVRYTASGRLGIWDSVDKKGMDKWRSQLDELLQSNAHGVIESDYCDLTETDDPDLAATTAICDKIIARGNPTLVDPNWERILLSGPGSEFLRWEEPEDPEIKFCVEKFLWPEGSSYQLLDAAKDLLELPWSEEWPEVRQRLSADLLDQCSAEEEVFYAGLMADLGPRGSGAVQRQALISDLVDGLATRGLAESRVDFALQLSRLRWVIEVDGIQHMEPTQRGKDAFRDSTLQAAGWKVMRVGAAEVRSCRDGWLRKTWAGAESEESRSLTVGTLFRSAAEAMEESLLHRGAWNLLLRPLAVQRCLRGLLLLYRYGALDATRPQRILVVEEDMPAMIDACWMLRDLWKLTSALQPDLGVNPPTIFLDIINRRMLQDTAPWTRYVEGEISVAAGSRFWLRDSGLQVRYVDQPEEGYDAVISHSFLLAEGYPGPLLDQVAPELANSALRIRRAVGCRSERSLLWSKGFNYRLKVETEIQEKALRHLLQTVFRKRNFRDGQLKSISRGDHTIVPELKSISRLLNGDHTIVLLPTGGGKSLIYQFAGMLLPGMTVIVDPIISLMDDQVFNLKRSGIDRVEGISGQQRTEERVEGLRRMAGGQLSYIFMSPERLQSAKFREELQEAKAHVPVSLVALDEAHCLSEWGHDFRPAYLHLPLNLQRYCKDKDTGALPNMVALTGTASFAVLGDIQAELKIDDEDAIIRPASFNRKELSFEVRRVSPRSRSAELRKVRQEMPQRWGLSLDEFFKPDRGVETDCGLVFCPHVNGGLGVVKTAERLGHANYYSGKAPRNFSRNWIMYKKDMQRRFTKSSIQELVTTKSFGMGIDKENIRYTVHYVMPASIEQFYQEAGRAGRKQNCPDNYALCTVIYSHDKWEQAKEILKEEDHSKAMSRLEEVQRGGRGDVLVHLWFLLNSYKGREEEKENTLELWRDFMADEWEAGVRTVQIPFGQDRESREKSIYRLAILGIVEDYTVQWMDWGLLQKGWFSVELSDGGADNVRGSLSNYLRRYKFQDYVDEKLDQVCGKGLSEVLEQAVGVLVDFIYEEVVKKRKQAIHNMAELCRDYRNSDDFRDEILNYLQDSKFSELLNSWRGRPLKEIGLENVRNVITGSDARDQLRALIGTIRRMLEADPGNVALRYLSVCARAVSPWESNRSVVDETGALFVAADTEGLAADDLRLDLLQDIVRWRLQVATSVVRTMVSDKDGLNFARRLLSVGRTYGDGVRLAALCAISSNAVEAFTRINRFYDLELPGGQDDTRGE